MPRSSANHTYSFENQLKCAVITVCFAFILLVLESWHKRKDQYFGVKLPASLFCKIFRE